jgi:serine protease Do
MAPALIAASLTAFLSPAPAAQTAEQDDQSASLAMRRSPIVEVYESAKPSVVNIKATELVRSYDESSHDDSEDGARRSRARRINNVGSGFVIHPDGYIITNSHVIERAVEQRVIFADGREFRATVVASEPSFDLAVLKIDAPSPLPTLALGRSDDLLIGETVIAVGNPLGHQNTVTTGVVSATGRDVEIDEDLILRGLIQTDAPINPGNSGGPLLNVMGQLIGVNSAICDEAQGISFAIPVDQLRLVMPKLLDSERRFAIESGLSVDMLTSAKVTAVLPSSPAEAAGLRPGDVLTRVDDCALRSGIDYWFSLLGHREGDALRISYCRGETEGEAVVTLARRRVSAAQLALERLGVEVEDVSSEQLSRLRAGNLNGVAVKWVEPNGPADRAGIEPRDLLLSVGPRGLQTIEDLRETLESLPFGDMIPVEFGYLQKDEFVRQSRQVRVR